MRDKNDARRYIDLKRETVVRCRCVCCGSVRDVRFGEVHPTDGPMCQLCMGPMVALRATSTAGKRK